MGEQTHSIPFLVNPDNAAYFTRSRRAVPQQYGDGSFNLIVGGVVGAGALALIPVLFSIGAGLALLVLLIIGAAMIGALVFALVMLREGWRAVQTARLYRRHGRQVTGVLESATLVDEGGGDYFLTVTYRFQTPEGGQRTGSITHYRPDLAGSTLPQAGTPLTVLYADADHHVVL